MLNRLYIVIGTLAILVLAGAFLLPRFVQWGDYRERMEQLAGEVLGTPVIIRGDIDFSLLPQPQLRFTDVLVGAPEEPAATVGAVEAEFALIDFLRDNYRVTRLVLNEPVIDFTIDESGLFGSGVAVSNGSGGVSLSEASIVDGTVRLADRRAGENFVLDDLDGEWRLGSFTGPLQFQGNGDFREQRYGIRFNSGAAGADGATQVSLYLAPQGGGGAFRTDGTLSAGVAPKFDGTVEYRVTPPAAQAAEDIQGDFVFQSNVQASTDRVVLSGYTVQPDENRAGTRLTGSASIQLGARRFFDAVISGGVFALPPRPADEDPNAVPYDVVRLLAELPAPPVPPMAGRVGIDLAEIDLRSFGVRNVRVDAQTDGTAWTVSTLTGVLPGGTTVRASGTLSRDGAAPAFQGQVDVQSARLDALAALWRKAENDNPLFGQSGGLTGQVILGQGALGLTSGVLTVGGTAHATEVRIGFGEEQRLDVVAHLDDLDAAHSAMVAALVPEVGQSPAFGLSFPEGSFSLSADAARLWGLDGRELRAEGQWQGDAITVSRLQFADWGGLGIEGTVEASGTLAEPDLVGTGTVRVTRGDAPGLVALYDRLGTPQGWRGPIGRFLPGAVRFDLGAPDRRGAQVLVLDGTLGDTELDARATLSAGLGGALVAPLMLTGTLEAADGAALSAQFGFGSPLLQGEGPLMVALGLDGVASETLDVQLTASQGSDSVRWSGPVGVDAGGEIAGSGRIAGELADAGSIALLFGGDGLVLPALAGEAEASFTGGQSLRLDDIAAEAGGAAVSGNLALERLGGVGRVSGALALERADATALAGALFGPAALVGGGEVWPEGPITLNSQARSTRGTVAVTAAAFGMGEHSWNDARFSLIWDESQVRLAEWSAVAPGGGQASLDVTVCCTGGLSDKTVSGRLALQGVPVAAVVPAGSAEAATGTVSGGAQFEGTGASLAAVMGAMTGEGNLEIADLAVGRLAPAAFTTAAGLEDALTTPVDAVRILLDQALRQGAFEAPSATGAFTIAGGVARLANLLVEGDGARLTGDVSVTLARLGLGGAVALTPLDLTDPAGLVTNDTGRISATLGGTLLQPTAQVDLDELVAAVQVRANEIELDRLEQVAAEDAERQREAAEERNRLVEEQLRAAEEARRQAAEQAAREAADAAAAQGAEQNVPVNQPVDVPDAVPATPEQVFAPGSLDLQLPGTGVAQ